MTVQENERDIRLALDWAQPKLETVLRHLMAEFDRFRRPLAMA